MSCELDRWPPLFQKCPQSPGRKIRRGISRSSVRQLIIDIVLPINQIILVCSTKCDHVLFVSLVVEQASTIALSSLAKCSGRREFGASPSAVSAWRKRRFRTGVDKGKARGGLAYPPSPIDVIYGRAGLGATCCFLVAFVLIQSRHQGLFSSQIILLVRSYRHLRDPVKTVVLLLTFLTGWIGIDRTWLNCRTHGNGSSFGRCLFQPRFQAKPGLVDFSSWARHLRRPPC